MPSGSSAEKSPLRCASLGTVNWPGSGFDPETAIFYTQAGNSAVTAGGFGGEEFEFIRVENQKTARKPRWEADPEYGRYGTNQPGAAPIQTPAAGRGGAGRGGGAEPGAAAAAPAGGARGSLTQGLDGLLSRAQHRYRRQVGRDIYAESNEVVDDRFAVSQRRRG